MVCSRSCLHVHWLGGVGRVSVGGWVARGLVVMLLRCSIGELLLLVSVICWGLWRVSTRVGLLLRILGISWITLCLRGGIAWWRAGHEAHFTFTRRSQANTL